MSVIDPGGDPAAEPVVADDSYLRAVTAATERAVAAAEPIESTFDGAGRARHDEIEQSVLAHADELVGLSRDLHAHPEEGFAEHHSVERVTGLLRRHGHRVETELGGLATAFRVVAGAGHPHVAVLAEYDALPGIGHGCGHNIICAAGTGGFLGAAPVVESLGGRVSLIGTPAEEGGGGKELLARQGVFDDVDAVVMLHPFSHDIAVHPFLGRRQVEMVFHGVAAHASAQPFMGRNALDAVVAAYQGVAAMRQHLPSTDRVHGIITEGGKRPNVVPDRAAALFYLRSAEPGPLHDLARRVEAVAAGAAEMTGCGIEVRWDRNPAYLPIRHNDTLAACWARHQSRRGRTSLPRGVVPEYLTGSTDLGNLSHRMPAIHPMIALEGENLALHTAEFAAAAGSATGDRAVLDGAVGLASTTADYLADAALRRAVGDEFEAAGGALDVTTFFG
ncbi:amidohydrolase [Halopolyspora algeriensis]|uniref:Peptidase M20 domain-containing protein 2 n=1 Tax=Halopolyspora algeriensis TaxID=1500506 RepID=A0A368VN67_9ACTN|nr:amidohydrolase [Halopolyspora algeriensis]RCW43161.1 amidohydrolase [Halopolyspora algeriensis]TQM56219.1 amidohydrolase [Halopolyspora algeriensis]